MSEARFAALFGKRPTTIKLNLERMQTAYQHLGQPAMQTPCVLVAGTNGKGTTAAFLYDFLSSLGLRVGLYTSPHLRHVSERIQISDQAIDDAAVIRCWEEIQARLPAQLYEDLTFFEVITLIGLTIFATAETDFNVIEVGLGGRLDATNILEPMATIITSIGLDHQQYLGNTIGKIAFEKAGIMRSGVPVFVGSGGSAANNAVAKAVISDMARSIGAPMHTLTDLLPLMTGRLPAIMTAQPQYMLGNFVLAVATVDYLITRLPKLSLQRVHIEQRWQQVLTGFPDPQRIWPAAVHGRFQRLVIPQSQPPVELLLDVGHNVDGIQALGKALQHAGYVGAKRRPALVSVLEDKDINEMLAVLKGILDPIVLFRINHERSWQKRHLAAEHQQLPFFSDFAGAWNYLRQEHSTSDYPWVVCGSVIAIGQVMDFFDAKGGSLAFGAPLTGTLPQ